MRLIAYEVKGEPEPVRLVTDLVDPREVAARESALLYHERWEAEVSYDEVKVHLQTVKHGKQHMEFRSKSPDLVEQEFWAMLATYNLVRELMVDAGRVHDIPPREISFVDSLEVIGLTLAQVQAAPDRRLPYLHRRLLADLAECRLDRPRRPRVYDRACRRHEAARIATRTPAAPPGRPRTAERYHAGFHRSRLRVEEASAAKQ